ncbi:hypothetical protein [Streptomyces phaeochromogenes]
MPPHDMNLIDHPAGPDEKLRLACEDLQLDRWLEAKRLLRDTGDDWPLRTSRSQVLARGAANNRAIDAWCAEEPNDPDALMMRARVNTERVLNAHRGGVSGWALRRAVDAADAACQIAADWWPKDPVPPVCQLALAQTDTDEMFPHNEVNWGRPFDVTLPLGPWRLLERAHRLDRYGREAHHRMLGVFHARGGGGLNFAHAVAYSAPEGSALHLLPLYAHVEAYRRQLQGRQTAGVIGYWSREDAALCAEQARYSWFEQTQPNEGVPDPRSVLDLNYLAYALTVTGVGNAAEVFEAIGPYATLAPWAQVTPNYAWWQDEFRSARRKAMSLRSRR